MSFNLQSVVAQLNSEQAKKPTQPKPKDKAAGAKAKPQAGRADDPNKAKLNLKGTINNLGRPRQPAAASNIAAANAVCAAARNPSSAPLGKRLKDVMDCLIQNVGQELSLPQLKEKTGQDLSQDQELVEALHKHPRVKAGPNAGGSGDTDSPIVASSWYIYRPEIEEVTDSTTLLNYVRDLKGRAALAETLRKCYKTAGDDLQLLKKQGKIFIIQHLEPEKESVFECDMMGMGKITQDVQNLWFEVRQEHIKDRLPNDMQDLQNAVTKAGLRSALANQPVKRQGATAMGKEKKKKPRQQRFNLDKATNAHLPQLFSGSQPKNIDT